jgi:hypothetical protein
MSRLADIHVIDSVAHQAIRLKESFEGDLSL